MKIYLIGMPGSGKSTLGKILAAQLQFLFIDLDEEIVKKSNKPVNEIFEEEGEEYFRKMEATLLRELTQHQDSFVMATGGGTPCFFDNSGYINSEGISIFLNIPLSEIQDRLLKKGLEERPLLRKISADQLDRSMQQKLEERIHFYKKAHVEFNHDATAEDIITKLRTQFNLKV